MFSYAHVPWMRPAQKILDRGGALPAPETKLAMLKLVMETLTGRGYAYIGMDHFARESDELARARAAGTLQRNFQGYSTQAGCEIMGFGMSSVSQTPSGYRQNHKELGAYRAALERGEFPVGRGLEATEEDRRRQEIIMRIMCYLRLDFAEVSGRFGFDFAGRYAGELAKLEPLALDGLVEVTGKGLLVTEVGRLFLRNIAVCFDAYYEAGAKHHARAV